MNTLAKYILHAPNALCKPLCMAALLCGLSALAGIVTGCEDKPLAFNYCPTPVEGWEPGDTLKFHVDTTDFVEVQFKNTRKGFYRNLSPYKPGISPAGLLWIGSSNLLHPDAHIGNAGQYFAAHDVADADVGTGAGSDLLLFPRHVVLVCPVGVVAFLAYKGPKKSK